MMPDRTYFEKMETMRCSIVAIVTAEPSITLFPIVMIPSSIKLQLKLMYEPSPIYIYMRSIAEIKRRFYPHIFGFTKHCFSHFYPCSRVFGRRFIVIIFFLR